MLLNFDTAIEAIQSETFLTFIRASYGLEIDQKVNFNMSDEASIWKVLIPNPVDGGVTTAVLLITLLSKDQARIQMIDGVGYHNLVVELSNNSDEDELRTLVKDYIDRTFSNVEVYNQLKDELDLDTLKVQLSNLFADDSRSDPEALLQHFNIDTSDILSAYVECLLYTDSPSLSILSSISEDDCADYLDYHYSEEVRADYHKRLDAANLDNLQEIAEKLNLI